MLHACRPGAACRILQELWHTLALWFIYIGICLIRLKVYLAFWQNVTVISELDKTPEFKKNRKGPPLEKRKKNIFVTDFLKFHFNYMGYSSICSKFYEKIRMPNLNLTSNSQCCIPGGLGLRIRVSHCRHWSICYDGKYSSHSGIVTTFC